MIQSHCEGSGITPFNVWDLSLEWWRRYRDIAVATQEELNKQHKQSKRGQRG